MTWPSSPIPVKYLQHGLESSVQHKESVTRMRPTQAPRARLALTGRRKQCSQTLLDASQQHQYGGLRRLYHRQAWALHNGKLIKISAAVLDHGHHATLLMAVAWNECASKGLTSLDAPVATAAAVFAPTSFVPCKVKLSSGFCRWAHALKLWSVSAMVCHKQACCIGMRLAMISGPDR